MNKSINSKLNIVAFGFILMVVFALGGAMPEKVAAQYYGGYSTYTPSPYRSYGDTPTTPVYQPQQPAVVYVPVTKTVTRTVVRNVNTNSSTNNTNTTAYNNQNQNTPNVDEKRVSELAANSLFGSNSFVPTGLTQWIMFAILILIIVILVRKVFGGEDRYHAAPMKHA